MYCSIQTSIQPLQCKENLGTLVVGAAGGGGGYGCINPICLSLRMQVSILVAILLIFYLFLECSKIWGAGHGMCKCTRGNPTVPYALGNHKAEDFVCNSTFRKVFMHTMRTRHPRIRQRREGAGRFAISRHEVTQLALSLLTSRYARDWLLETGREWRSSCARAARSKRYCPEIRQWLLSAFDLKI